MPGSAAARPRSRCAAAPLAARLARRRPGVPVAVVHLGLDHFEGLRSGVGRPLAVLGDRRVVAAAGIADPLSFAVQIRSLGAQVELLAFPDHHPYAPQDVARLVQAAAEARSEEHTSELQSRGHLVCRLLLEKKNT